MTNTVWPASTSRWMTPINRRTSAMCNPIVGSSRMNRFFFVSALRRELSLKPLNRCVTSLTRWASPPLSVGLVCPSLR